MVRKGRRRRRQVEASRAFRRKNANNPDPQWSRLARLEVVTPIERAPTLTSPVLMRLAVVHGLAGNREPALHFVGRALKAGYSANEVANDPELTSLRADRRYHALMTAPSTR